MGYGQLPVIREYDSSGVQIYQAEFGPIYPTGAYPVSSYRAYKYAWNATPSIPPKLVAQAANGSTSFYVSWNGATNIDSWVVSVGDSSDKLSSAFTIPKNGFETKFTFSGPFKYLSATAISGNRTLASSNVLVVDGDFNVSNSTNSIVLAPGSGGVKTSGILVASTISRSSPTAGRTTATLAAQLPDGQSQATSASAATPTTSVVSYVGNGVAGVQAGSGKAGALVAVVGVLLL